MDGAAAGQELGAAGGTGGTVEARTFRAERRVRLGDVGPAGSARLDALARYLQDVAADDVRDAGVAGNHRWVVRRTRLEVRRRPRYEELLVLTTWCSGTGAAWAERRTSVVGAGGAAVEATSLWVSLDPATMRPAPLGERFAAVYGGAAAGRTVRARLLHPPAPAGNGAVEEAVHGTAQQWRPRLTDFDVLGHMNNAVAWAILEEHLAEAAPGSRVAAAEIEYREPVEPGDVLSVRRQVGDARGTAAVSVPGAGERGDEAAAERLSGRHGAADLALWLADGRGRVTLTMRAWLSGGGAGSGTGGGAERG